MDGHKSFDILSREQSLVGHKLLEASAGTGKTFAIENYIVRSLLNEDETSPKQLDDILVLTFTRAAAHDLKTRIKSCLKKSCLELNGHGNPPCYLQKILEQGQEASRCASIKLRSHLLQFEKAHIFTIHGFCHKALADFSLLDSAQGLLSRSSLRRCILDFIRTEMNQSFLHPWEWGILAKRYSVDQIIDRVERLMTNGTSLVVLPTFQEGYNAFSTLTLRWHKEFAFEPERLFADFCLLAKNYKEVFTRSGDLQPHFVRAWEAFIHALTAPPSFQSFANLIENGLIWTSALDKDNLKKKITPVNSSQLYYPFFDELVRQELAPLLVPHLSPQHILIRLAQGARIHLQRYMGAEQSYTYDDLLRLTEQKAVEESFASALREKYRLVIVDEFQDTDPAQWRILRNLFLDTDNPWQGNLVLVGDPKQSIYSFRQADIYTYLEAGSRLGKAAAASLETNYRSHPKLLQGLNQLFCSSRTRDLIKLPAMGDALKCLPLKAGLKEDQFSCLPLHEIGIFISVARVDKKGEGAKKILPEEETYSYIAREILRLQQNYQIAFDQCAVLVNTRFQSSRLGEIFKEFQIPFSLHKERSLLSSPAYGAIYELLIALINCRDLALIKVALAGEILQCHYQTIHHLEEDSILSDVLKMFSRWNQILIEKGLVACFQTIFRTTDLKDKTRTYAEKILAEEGGDIFFQELLQILELLIDRQGLQPISPKRLVETFNYLKELEENEDSILQPTGLDERKGVEITTIHSSKGLEYDIVFAVGVAERSISPDLYTIRRQNDERHTVAVEQDSEDHLLYCAEIDAEKMRQFYVAATRAKYKLYLFLVAGKDGVFIPSSGQAAQMELLFKHVSKNSEIYLKDVTNFIEELDEGSQTIYRRDIPSEVALEKIIMDKPKPEVYLNFPSITYTLPSPLYISSFTSLSSPIEHSAKEMAPPQDFECLDKTPHTLPAGSATGIILHSLLEAVHIGQADRKEVLEKHLQHHLINSPLAAWQDVLIDMVYQAYNTPLSFRGLTFCLSQIDPQLCYRETEFLYVESPQYIRGVMDLIFLHEGKYFIVDWKSNWLGPDSTYYQKEYLFKAMKSHHYFLQAYIYKNALRKYMRLIEKKSFEDCFGGVYYLFLRGLSASRGIFYANP